MQVHCLGAQWGSWLLLWWAWCGLACRLHAWPCRSSLGSAAAMACVGLMLPLAAGIVPFKPTGYALHLYFLDTLRDARALGGAWLEHMLGPAL